MNQKIESSHYYRLLQHPNSNYSNSTLIVIISSPPETELLSLQQEVAKEEALLQEVKATMMQNKAAKENAEADLADMNEKYAQLEKKTTEEKLMAEREHEEEINSEGTFNFVSRERLWLRGNTVERLSVV
jgi:hypothetical protein